MNIIFKNLDGGVAVFTPTQEAIEVLSTDEIAKKVVPSGVAYWIVADDVILTDRTFRDAWEIDEAALGAPHGFGGEE